MFDSQQMRTFQYKKLFHVTIAFSEAFKYWKLKCPDININLEDDHCEDHWYNDTLCYTVGNMFFKKLIKEINKINYYLDKHRLDILDYFDQRLSNLPELIKREIHRIINEPFELRKKKEDHDQYTIDLLNEMQAMIN